MVAGQAQRILSDSTPFGRGHRSPHAPEQSVPPLELMGLGRVLERETGNNHPLAVVRTSSTPGFVLATAIP
jgi:hypothetical protein